MNIQKRESRYHIIAAVSSLTSLIGVGTVIFHFLEKWDWAQSFYFSVVTLTTVGYGDLHATSDLSRVVVAIYILIGVGTALGSITVIATDRINRTADRMRNIADNKKD